MDFTWDSNIILCSIRHYNNKANLLMPLKLQILSAKGAEWEGWCRHRLEAFRIIRSPGRIIKQSYSLPKGIMAQIICSDICDIIRIWGGAVSGFICHARSDLFPGGVKPDGTAISAVYPYPLVDNDHGSTVLTSGGKPPVWGASRDVENYGNIDWLGTDGKAISFRGPSSRQFPLDPTISYPGFTVFDESVGDLLPVDYFTPFSPNVYSEGNISKTMKGKVTGVSSLYTVVSMNYRGMTNPDGGVGGFYDEVWTADKRIGWRSGDRPSICWFFNQTGDKAVNGNTELSVAITTDSLGKVNYIVTFSQLDIGSGTSNYSFASGAWSLSKSGSWPQNQDFSNNILQGIKVTSKYSESTQLTGNPTSTTVELPIMYSGTLATGLTVSGPDDYTVPSDYTFTVNDNGTVCANAVPIWVYPTGCGIGTVIVTLGSLSGSKQVRMPVGTWVLVSSDNYGGSGTYTRTCYLGLEKIILLMGEISNVLNGPGMEWNGLACIPHDIPISDEGLPGGFFAPVCGDLIFDTHTTTDGHCYSLTYNSWYFMIIKSVYQWVCP